MDEEGFPLLRQDAQLIPEAQEFFDHIDDDRQPLVDHESGEITGEQIMVLRRPGSLLLVHDSCQNGDCRQQRQQLYAPLYWPPSPHLAPRFQPHRFWLPVTEHQKQQEQKMVTKNHFRIPLNIPKVERDHRKVTITIRKELFQGALVYSNTTTERLKRLKQSQFVHQMELMFGDIVQVVPFVVLWLIRLVVILLKTCIPKLGIQLCYMHFVFSHMKIHLVGEEQGKEPVFIGRAYQGPLIYGIRHYTCPYCRHKRECRASLMYLQSLRQDWAANGVR